MGSFVWRDFFHVSVQVKQVDFLIALNNNDFKEMEKVLQGGLDPNRVLAVPVKAHRIPPLFFAASIGNKEAVLLLLAYGANPRQADYLGDTAIERAKYWGHSEIAEILSSAVYPLPAKPPRPEP